MATEGLSSATATWVIADVSQKVTLSINWSD